MDRPDLNSASYDQLVRIPHIDDARARLIIERRPFRGWDDLGALGFDEDVVAGLRAAFSLGTEATEAAEPAPRRADDIPGDVTEAPEEEGRATSWF